MSTQVPIPPYTRLLLMLVEDQLKRTLPKKTPEEPIRIELTRQEAEEFVNEWMQPFLERPAIDPPAR